MHDEDEVLSAAAAWLEAGEAVALATVIDTWGSSPRPRGSRMAVSRGGAIAGSVSGGCVEAAVIAAAQACMSEGRPRELVFGVTDENAWAVGLPCGGRIAVWIEPVA